MKRIVLTSILLVLVNILLAQLPAPWLSTTTGGPENSHPYNSAKHEVNACVLNYGSPNAFGFLYAGKGTNACWVHQRNPDTLIKVANIPSNCHHGQGWTLNGHAFTGLTFGSGNFPNENPHNVIYRWEQNNSWHTQTTVPSEYRVGAASSCVISATEVLFSGGLTGGHSSGHTTRNVIYNISNGKWTVKTPVPEALDHHSAARWGDYVILGPGRRSKQGNGGLHSNMVNAIYRYHIPSDTWSNIGTVPTPRAGANVAIQNIGGTDYFLVMGGEDDHPTQSGRITYDIVEALNLQTGQWSTFPSLNQARHAFGVLKYANDTLYTIAGSDNAGGDVDGIDPNYVESNFVNTAFPIDFLSIRPYQDKHLIKVDVETYEDLSDSVFLQKIVDDSGTWKTIHAQKSKGARNQFYTFVDSNPFLHNIYRFQQIDFNRSKSLSSVLEVDYDPSSYLVVQQLGGNKFRIVNQEVTNILLTDMSGKAQRISLEEGILNLSQMPTGIYHIRYKNLSKKIFAN